MGLRDRATPGRRVTKRPLLCMVMLLWTAPLWAGCQQGGEMSVLDVDPQAGHTKGDQYVKISGRNLRSDIGYTVYFGAQKASQVMIMDPETLMVRTPAGNAPGAVDIMIRADNGAAWRIREGFRFEDMSGSIIERLGEPAEAQPKGNLAY